MTKIAAYIEAAPVGTSPFSSWPGRKGNQLGMVAEGDADISGLRSVAQALHDRMGLVGWFALDAWIECGERRVGYCQLGHMSYSEVLRGLVAEG